MKHYPEYKESGVEWIGDIPAHWEVIRNKFIFQQTRDVSYPNLLLLSIGIRGIIPKSQTDQKDVSSADKSLYKRVKIGDIAFNVMTAWKGGIGMSDYEGIVSPAYQVCRPTTKLVSKYFHYLFRTDLYKAIFDSASYQVVDQRHNLYYDNFKNISAIFPPFSEQTQIAAFLDQKTGQIDELIRVKERRIELLQEQRTVLINQAVTKGFDPNVEMKPSGVEWIEEIPVHWEIGKIKHIATFLNEKSIPETDAIKISPENVESETGKILNFYSSYDSVGVKFQTGDVLFNKLRVYLSKAAFAEYNGYSLGEMIVIRPSLQYMGKYLFYLMLSSHFIEYCNSISYGVKMPRTGVDDILNAQIPMTSKQEQTQIANFLDCKTKQIDDLIATEQRKIELLKEYRQSLISEAVTGKIDVRNEV